MKVFVIEVVLVSFIIYSMFESLMCSLMNRFNIGLLLLRLGLAQPRKDCFWCQKKNPKEKVNGSFNQANKLSFLVYVRIQYFVTGYCLDPVLAIDGDAGWRKW